MDGHISELIFVSIMCRLLKYSFFGVFYELLINMILLLLLLLSLLLERFEFSGP